MKSVTVTAGYAYEKYTYSDIQTDNYKYVLSDTYLTGAYSDSDYKANIYFVGITYRF